MMRRLCGLPFLGPLLLIFFFFFLALPQNSSAQQESDGSASAAVTAAVQDLLGYYSWEETYTTAADDPTQSQSVPFPLSFEDAFSLRFFRRAGESAAAFFVLITIAMGEDFVVNLELVDADTGAVQMLQGTFVTQYLCTKTYRRNKEQCETARLENRPFQRNTVQPILSNVTRVQYTSSSADGDGGGIVTISGPEGSIVGHRREDPLEQLELAESGAATSTVTLSLAASSAIIAGALLLVM